jgi:hypothetical protein
LTVEWLGRSLDLLIRRDELTELAKNLKTLWPLSAQGRRRGILTACAALSPRRRKGTSIPQSLLVLDGKYQIVVLNQ